MYSGHKVVYFFAKGLYEGTMAAERLRAGHNCIAHPE